MSTADAPPAPTAPPAQATPATKPTPRPQPPALDRLPPFKVLLHNDDIHTMPEVVRSLNMVTPLTTREAMRVMLEAHSKGVGLVMTTHRERAELYADRIRSTGLTASVEPDR